MKRQAFFALPLLALSLTACANEAQGAVKDLLKTRDSHEVSRRNGVTHYDFGSTELARNTTLEATSENAWRMTMGGPKLDLEAFGKMEPLGGAGASTLYNITDGPFEGGQLEDFGGQEFQLSSAEWVKLNPDL